MITLITLSRRRLGVGVAVVLVLAGVAIWLVAFSSVFGVGTVRVDGLRTLTAQQVRHAAAIDDGTPLLRLDRAAVERRVESLPVVADATVRTSFPSTVIISVRERIAVGYEATDTGFRLVDATGFAYQAVASRPAHLPRLDLSAEGGHREIAAAVATVAAALPASVRAQVLTISAITSDSVTLLLADRRVVQWGSPERSADKARILPALLRTRSSQIDVSNPELPYTR